MNYDEMTDEGLMRAYIDATTRYGVVWSTESGRIWDLILARMSLDKADALYAKMTGVPLDEIRHSREKTAPIWRVAWVDDRTGAEGINPKPMTRMEADAWVQELNALYTDVRHWVVRAKED